MVNTNVRSRVRNTDIRTRRKKMICRYKNADEMRQILDFATDNGWQIDIDRRDKIARLKKRQTYSY